MINKIIGSTFFVCALFALSLALLGVDGPIRLAPSFRAFIVTCNYDLENYKIAIPDITFRFDTEGINEYLEGENIITIFKDFVVGFYGFLNFIIDFFQFLITFINVFISTLQFFFIILRNLINYRDGLVENIQPLIA